MLFKLFLPEFPDFCTNFNPPHQILCHQAIWEDAGCTSRGEKYPMSDYKIVSAGYDNLNLR